MRGLRRLRGRSLRFSCRNGRGYGRLFRPAAALAVSVASAVLGIAMLGVLSLGGVSRAQDAPSAAEHGAAVYEAWCAHCHDAGPEGSPLEKRPGVEQLELKYGGVLSAYIKQRPDLASAAVLAAFLRNGAGSMPPFRKTEITDEDIEALAAYFKETSAAAQ